MNNRKLIRYLILFLLTVITTTLAGAEWMFGRFLFLGENPMRFQDFLRGFQFSVPFLLILTVHEFGHYFTARYHQIRVTLPSYIPLWLGFITLPSFGTMGAFIRILDEIKSRKHYFDVGISGPLAGFIVAIFVIWYGFTHLPPQEYIYQIHPEYEAYGLDYASHVYDNDETMSFKFGGNILFYLFETFVLDDPALMPHPNEIIHYPYLLAGYLALFFTALNLLPIGQLDGGHVLFGLVGPKYSNVVNKVLYIALISYAGLGLINMNTMQEASSMGLFYFIITLVAYLYFLKICFSSMIEDLKSRWLIAAVVAFSQYLINYLFGLEGYHGWLLFAFIIGRFLGVYHPPAEDLSPLDNKRKWAGWLALLIFILCFSPQPFIIE